MPLSRLATAVLALAIFPATTMALDDSVDFAHLSVYDGGLVARHALPMHFEADPAFSLHAPAHRTARFNDVPFEVSLGAFLTDDRAILIHAEHVTDLSGAANYDRYAVSGWPMAEFRGPGAVCHEIPAEAVDGEHDLMWLRERGFEPSGAIWMEQHFASGNDYNDEIVVSLLVKVDACEEHGAAPEALIELRERLQVSAIE
jgi:hypothetical protein